MQKLRFNYFLILCSFLLNIASLFGQASWENRDINNYVNSLMNLNFQEALYLTNQVSDDELSNTLKDLADILYSNGQEKSHSFLISNDSIDDVITNHTIRILQSLKKGYQTLYHKTGEDSLDHFFLAYSIAKENDNTHLHKLSLLAILEYYQFKYSQTNDQYISYLKELESLSKTNLDYVWLYLYKVYFNLQSLSKENWSTTEDFQILEDQMNSIGENSNLWPLFYSLKALKLEYADKEKEALKYHQIALNLSKEEPFLKYIAFRSLIRMSIVKQKEREFKKGIVLLDSALKFINKSDSLRSLIYINKYKSKHNLELNNYDSAYAQLQRSIDLEHKLEYKTDMLEKSALEVKLRTAEKEKQILEEKQRTLTNRNWLIAASLALLFGTGIAILLQKNTFKKRQLAEKETQLKQERVDNLLKGQELMSIDAMIAGQEKERQRVANELHDDLGSLMATIKLHFDNSKISKEDPGLQNAKKLLEEAYQKVRSMAHSKNSGVMSSQGLLPAIKKMAKVITETNALMVSVEDFGMGERLENSLELNLFRTIQELVANAIKHANATNVNIQLTQHEDILNIIVEDNGKGFDRSKIITHSTGMGLTNIEKRIEHLEGNFTVDSVLGKGTSILIDIPL